MRFRLFSTLSVFLLSTGLWSCGLKNPANSVDKASDVSSESIFSTIEYQATGGGDFKMTAVSMTNAVFLEVSRAQQQAFAPPKSLTVTKTSHPEIYALLDGLMQKYIVIHESTNCEQFPTKGSWTNVGITERSSGAMHRYYCPVFTYGANYTGALKFPDLGTYVRSALGI